MKLSDKITILKGIGEKRAELFKKVGVNDIGSLLYYYPRTYTEYPEVLTSLPKDLREPVAVSGLLLKKPSVRKTKTGTVTVAYLIFKEIKIELVWFNVNHIAKSLGNGGEFVYFGRLFKDGNGYKMEQPSVFTPEKYSKMKNRPIPIYPLTKDLKNNVIKSAMENAFSDIGKEVIGEYLEPEYLKETGLLEDYKALCKIHFPDSYEELKAARNRLIFDEFFNFFMEVKTEKQEYEEIENTFSFSKDKIFNRALSNLPFSLTKGQMDAVNQIKSELLGRKITQRMIQGDVGSGKTVIAFLSMVLCAENGYKSAVMAPTEVLAVQHYKTFLKFKEICGVDFPVILLTGKMSAKEKRIAVYALSEPGGAFVVGTHALIQEKVKISDLALCIVDEQHRFGVKQRAKLSDKGKLPFNLVMSATPIPRSLAMIIYGDMNITVIKDVPNIRLPIKNAVINQSKRETAYKFILKEVDKGHQAYIICPLVSASEKSEAESATEYSEELKKIFPKTIKIGLLHGKMDSKEKTEVMEEFSKGNTHVLVSTTVIEVGIDVPNSTVIMIENATRFGLSQLHQLRGRVGRGDAQSYCIFMDDSKDGEENERLKVIGNSNDGFFIANEDMRLRGPGQLYGLRQSGEMGFALGDICSDSDILMMANEKASQCVNDKDFMKQWKAGLCRERLSWKSWYNI